VWGKEIETVPTATGGKGEDLGILASYPTQKKKKKKHHKKKTQNKKKKKKKKKEKRKKKKEKNTKERKTGRRLETSNLSGSRKTEQIRDRGKGSHGSDARRRKGLSS